MEQHGKRHDFDTRATQNDEKQGHVLRALIVRLTCDDATLREILKDVEYSLGSLNP